MSGAGPVRRLFLWRHGQTAWNFEQRCQGHADVPLDAEGLAQARMAAPLLAAERPDLIVTSDLSRA
ncbi:MAG: histidine phosphatase family protein, partial [Actinomycetota bacterium]|nr:histidine phosphatase family protein [Actinomycetota bacterium]